MNSSSLASVYLQGQEGHRLQCKRLRCANLGFNARYTFLSEGTSALLLSARHFARATIHIVWQTGEVRYHAELLTLSQMPAAHGKFEFTLQFGCSLHWLSDTINHRLYINDTLETMIRDVLSDYCITPVCQIKNQSVLPYMAQGGISDYEFLRLLCFEYGLVFYYLHEGDQAVLHITDGQYHGHQHTVMFNPDNGLVEDEGTITAAHCRRVSLPDHVHLRSMYDTDNHLYYESITSNQSTVSGQGILNLSHPVACQKACDRYAGQLQQQLDHQRIWLQVKMQGMVVQVGDVVQVNGHPASNMNGAFQVLTVSGSYQTAGEGAHVFRTTVILIPVSSTYRMPGLYTGQIWHESFGTLPDCWQPSSILPEPALQAARVVHGDNALALNEKGEYFIQPYFSKSKEKWYAVRMLQPAAGPKGRHSQGLHMPLEAGTHVILGHVHRQVNKPFILGVLPDKDQPDPVTSDNHTQLVLRHRSGSGLIFEEVGEAERAKLFLQEDTHGLFLEKTSNQESIQCRSLGSINLFSRQSLTLSGGMALKLDGKRAYYYAGDEWSFAAKQHLDIQAEKALRFYSGGDWRVHVSDDTLQWRCTKGFYAEGKTVLLTSKTLQLSCQYGHWFAKQALNLHAAKAVSLQVQSAQVGVFASGLNMQAPQITMIAQQIIKA